MTFHMSVVSFRMRCQKISKPLSFNTVSQIFQRQHGEDSNPTFINRLDRYFQDSRSTFFGGKFSEYYPETNFRAYPSTCTVSSFKIFSPFWILWVVCRYQEYSRFLSACGNSRLGIPAYPLSA